VNYPACRVRGRAMREPCGGAIIGAGRFSRVLCLWGAGFLVSAASLHGQAGCSDYLMALTDATYASDSMAAPLRALLPPPSRVPALAITSGPQVCRIALISALQNHRSGRTAVSRAFETSSQEARSAEYLYGLASSRNQTGRHRELLADPHIRSSTDPLVRFEVARALFLSGEADDGFSVLLSAVTEHAAAGALFAHFSYPALSTEARIQVARTEAPMRGARLLEEWERMAWSSGLTTSERLAVHFRRTVHADSMYFGVRRAMGDSVTAPIVGGREPDPRREVFIRFGAPWRMVHTPIVAKVVGFSADHITWAYPDPAARGAILFHFTGANSNYHMEYYPGCNELWLGDRATLSPRLGQLFQACLTRSPMLSHVATAYVHETRAEYAKNAQREFVLPAKAGVRSRYQLYIFENREGSGSEIVAAGVVPAEELPESRDFRAGFFLRSAAGSVAARVADQRLTTATDVVFALQIAGLSPGAYSYRLRTSDRDFQEGQVYGGDVSLPARSSAQLGLCDLIVAVAGSTGPLQRPGHSLQPIVGPVSQETFDLYYEVYGATDGEILDVEIAVARGRGLLRRRQEVTLRFRDTASGEGWQAFRRLIRHELVAGAYEVTVSLQSSRSGRVKRTTTIEVRR
jgi:hypothetical protein